MFQIDGDRHAACDGITRRRVLEAAGAGLFGLSLPRLLLAEDQVAGFAIAASTIGDLHQSVRRSQPARDL